MGSLGDEGALRSRSDRYFQGDVEDVAKLVPEGIEGPGRRTRGRSGRSSTSWWAACGRRWATAAPRHRGATQDSAFVRITAAGLRESHPHDVTITKEAPNYRRG